MGVGCLLRQIDGLSWEAERAKFSQEGGSELDVEALDDTHLPAQCWCLRSLWVTWRCKALREVSQGLKLEVAHGLPPVTLWKHRASETNLNGLARRECR